MAGAGQSGRADVLTRTPSASATSTTPTVDQDDIIAGTYHNGTGLGKITYIGGHSFSTSLPVLEQLRGAVPARPSTTRSFFNGSAVAKLDLQLSPTTFPQNSSGPLTAKIVNTGGSVATNTQ